jgi:hypothetical protein
MTWICKECGRTNQDTNSKCWNCGAEKNTSKPEPNDDEKKTKIPGWGAGAIIFAVGLIGFIILFVVSPLSQAFAEVIQAIGKYLALNFPPALVSGLMWWSLLLVITVAFLRVAAKKPNPKLLLEYLGQNLIYIDIFFVIILGYWFTLSSSIPNNPYFVSLKCVVADYSNYQSCIASTQPKNTQTSCKSTTDYKFLDIKFGQVSTNYKLIPPRENHIYSPSITILPYGDHQANHIVVSGQLMNESGFVVQMKADQCLTDSENCQVGPGIPSKVVTLRSVGPVPFIKNSLAYLIVSVSYPYQASGSNAFYIVGSNSNSDLSQVPKSPVYSLGGGPLDIYVNFNTNYYAVGDSAKNPDAATINVFSDISNGKKRCTGEDGFGRIYSIMVTHSSDVKGITAVCSTPEYDKFDEGQAFTLPGTKVSDTQEYNCTFTSPDAQLSGVKSVVFTTAINYDYTEVVPYPTGAMTVCSSDTSQSCISN